MNPDVTSDILSKLRGAMKLAEQADNVNEAKVAASFVQKLIQKYNIDLNDLPVEENKAPIVTKNWYSNGKNLNKPFATLAYILGKYNFVEVYTSHTWIRDDSGSVEVAVIAFVGREINVDAVMDLFYKMMATLNRLRNQAFAEYRNENNYVAHEGTHGKAWNSSWMVGAVNGLSVSLKQEQDAFLQMKSASGKTGMELVISLEAENKEYLKNMSFKKSAGTKIHDYSAYKNGYKTGSQLSTKEQIN